MRRASIKAAWVLGCVMVAWAGTPAARAAQDAGDAAGPAESSAPKTVALPAAVDDVVPAGGGRFLLLRMDKLAKLAIYDVAADKIKGYVPLGSTDALVAGGAEKLVLVARDKNVIQRWKLEPVEKELTVALSTGSPTSIAMGHASHGPLLVMAQGAGPQFLSLQTLKPIDVSPADPNSVNTFWRSDRQSGLQVAAAADGQTFAGWQRFTSPNGIRLLRLQGDAATSRYEHESAGPLLPSWDGSQLFTQNGVYSSDLKPLAADQFRQKTCIPAYRPGYFVTVAWADPFGGNPLAKAKPGVSLSVYTASDRAMLVTLPPMPEATQQRDAFPGAPGTLEWHKRIFPVPQCRRLVTVADTRDQLVVRPFDMMATLDRAGIDYLFVDSLPVTIAAAGKPYSYPIVVQSKKGGVKFSLDSGPDGMKISKDGVLTWQVPADVDPGPTGIIVTVEDAAGQSVFHTFNIQVTAPQVRPGVGGAARRIDLGPDPNQPGYGYGGSASSNTSGTGQPPVVRAVKKPVKHAGTAKAE